FSRLRRCESQTRDTVELRDRAEQRAEIASADRTAIRVDCLSKQLDLDAAAVDRRAYFRDHVIERTRHFTAVRRRHDAERAVLVAAFDDRYIRLRWRVAIDCGY